MTKKQVQMCCTFCAKNQKEVSKLIAGPGVCICSECIELCNEIIQEESVPGAPKSYELEDSENADTEQLLAMVSRTQAQAAPLDAYLTKLVHLLRSQGVTWARIGEALGVSRQAAWMRFSTEE